MATAEWFHSVMSTLTLKQVPESLLERLRAEAQRQRRRTRFSSFRTSNSAA